MSRLDCPSSTGRPASTRSIASTASRRRPPPALRGLGSTSRPVRAHAHVTLAFAVGDASSLPTVNGQGLRRAVSGASPVEEALSRQLDRDMAGQHLGLRSRRSSAATLASMRTDYSTHLEPQREEDDDNASEYLHHQIAPGPSKLRNLHADDNFEYNSGHLAPNSANLPGSSSRPTTPPPRNASADTSTANSPEGTPRSRRTNPKKSSSWLRWTSPAPSFPKKDKGKAREDIEEVASATPTGLAPAAVITSTTESSEPPPSRSTPAAPSPKPPSETADLPPASARPPPSHTDTPLTPAPDPARSKHQSVHASPAGVSLADEDHVSAILPLQPNTALNSLQNSTNSTARIVKTAMESGGDTKDTKAQPDLPPPQTLRGWRSYIWRSGDAAESSPKVDDKAVTAPGATVDPPPSKQAETLQTESKTSGLPAEPEATEPAKDMKQKAKTQGAELNGDAKRLKVDGSDKATTDTAPAVETTETTDNVKEEVSDDAAEASNGAVVAQPQGWSSYLASFVYRVEPAPAQSADAQPLADNSSTERNGHRDEQSASDLPPPTTVKQPAAPSPVDNRDTTAATTVVTPTDAEAIASSALVSSKLASSTSSAGGWLSYLALRASQKTITSSAASHQGRKSGETSREDVMDFSTDPDFPTGERHSTELVKTISATSAPKTDPKTKTKELDIKAIDVKAPPKGKDAIVAEELAKSADSKGKDVKAVNKGKDTAKLEPAISIKTSESIKGTTAKQVGHKRSQNISISERRQSSASSVRSAASGPPPSPTSVHVGSKRENSGLPPPAQAPSKQPNLVIPSFGTTFDRPPRSLNPRTAQEGVSATAWRALSYVYGNTNKDPVGETRGLKAGRDVGANLPRRIGLGGSGSPDDGWKNVHRVVVIGVHGWFPAKLLNSVIGEPTGTSVKFANMMGEAVKKFFGEKGIDESEIRLTQIPLEGEGVIDDRVDKLYKAYLSNPAWINDVRRADAIFFAAHSQGCIVTTHLISRMIAQGHIRTANNRDAVVRCEWAFGPIAIVPDDSSKKSRRLAAGLSGADGGRQKVAMLAMCGVHLGPFMSISTSSVIGPYLHWFENAAARELFEFQDTESKVSQAYQRSLAMILENEVRVLLLASLNDQVVPIYGASFATATHPLLLRALFVDGASYSASDFMTNLICFAFLLRNAGIDDQRLVEHLSEATAGSLTGVGHSSPYEELACYSLAVQYLLHAGPAAEPLPPLQVEPFAARDARNDFELPWIMRALVDAPEVKDLFPDELKDLRENIIAWKPTTKPLKEIKKRLEPMAGRPSRSLTSTTAAAATVTTTTLPKSNLKPHNLATSSSSTSLASMNEREASKKAQSRLSAGPGWADSAALTSRR